MAPAEVAPPPLVLGGQDQKHVRPGPRVCGSSREIRRPTDREGRADRFLRDIGEIHDRRDRIVRVRDRRELDVRREQRVPSNRQTDLRSEGIRKRGAFKNAAVCAETVRAVGFHRAGETIHCVLQQDRP